MSPSKVRLVAKTISGLPLGKAISALRFTGKKAAKLIQKTIESGVANAEHNFSLSADNLKIKKIEIGQGPTYKRWRARSRGMAHPILKKTSHIKVIIEEAEKGKEAKKSKAK